VVCSFRGADVVRSTRTRIHTCAKTKNLREHQKCPGRQLAKWISFCDDKLAAGQLAEVYRRENSIKQSIEQSIELLHGIYRIVERGRIGAAL
jgi:hypothetical protein